MNYTEALNYIHSNFWMGSKPGLERTTELLARLGDPQNRLSFIHVAGTNGKGSFCSMLSSILIRAGLKVGTYTSPYILRFNERMRINGRDIPDETLCRLVEYIRPIAEKMSDKPTEFELITALAMEYFAREECDVVVLECGMGGRLDSTNVICTPVLSVITGVAEDHTAFLGDTIEKIAFEKAGIIKKGVPVLCCDEKKAVQEVIKKRAEGLSSPLHLCDHASLSIHEMTLEGTRFSFGSHKDMWISLLGSFQPINAANVLSAVDLIREQGFTVSEKAVREGLASATWRARFEAVRKDPLILCDGGHNPEGVDAAVASVKIYFKEEKLHIITGCMKDKDYRLMAGKISTVAKDVFCLTPQSPRSLSAKELAEVYKLKGVPAKDFDSAKEAVRAAVNTAKKDGGAILCLGSLYMYEEIISALDEVL